MLLCHDGLCVCYSQQADLALQEAIRIAQEANDHVCLQHCLVHTHTHTPHQTLSVPVTWFKLLLPLILSLSLCVELAVHVGADEGM